MFRPWLAIFGLVYVRGLYIYCKYGYAGTRSRLQTYGACGRIGVGTSMCPFGMFICWVVGSRGWVLKHWWPGVTMVGWGGCCTCAAVERGSFPVLENQVSAWPRCSDIHNGDDTPWGGIDVRLFWVLFALSGRGLCDGLITRPEESYRLWCVVVCDLETSRMRRPWPALGRGKVCAC